MTELPALLPCPFCGSEPHVHPGCGCGRMPGGILHHHESCILGNRVLNCTAEQWNTRITPWRLIADDPPPLDTGVLVSDGKDVTAARWITEVIYAPHCVWGSDGEDLYFDPQWWAELPPAPGKETT